MLFPQCLQYTRQQIRLQGGEIDPPTEPITIDKNYFDDDNDNDNDGIEIGI
tara:strand:+ start:367 stop:519 length:153 start_codon:yes stop_codon:yes gene_type:complete